MKLIDVHASLARRIRRGTGRPVSWDWRADCVKALLRWKRAVARQTQASQSIVVGIGVLLMTGATIWASIHAGGNVRAQSLPSYAARSGLPSFHLVQPTATITPSAALSFYGSPSVSGHAPISPRIAALARALENDPDRIVQYVRNAVEYEPQFGLHKGADGVLLDGSGGAFDQAQLVVQLARAAGHGARYRLGVKTLGAEAASILRVTGARQACLLLAAGGTPATVNGQTSCAGLSGGVTAVQILHVWPEIDIDGVWYAFDPALKTHEPVSGLDVWAAAGTNAGSAWSNLMAGVSTGQASVTGVDPSSIAAKMAGYATTLQNALIANHGDKALEEVTGGWKIVQDFAVTRNTNLPGATVFSSWDGDVPAPYRAKVRFHTSGFNQTLDLASLYAYRVQAQINGQIFKLAVRRCENIDASPLAYFGGAQDVTGQSACEAQNTYVGVGDSTFASWDRRLDILLNHPYAANAGGFADEEISKSIEVGKRVDIVIRTAGGTGGRRATQAAAIDPLLDLKVVAEGSPYSCRIYGAPGPDQNLQVDDDCATDDGAEDWNYWVQDNDKFVKGVVIAAEMKSRKDVVVNLWAELFDSLTTITEGLSGARVFHQHSIGVALNPSYGPTALDVDTAVGAAPGGADQPHHVVSALASLSSAAEAAAVAHVASEESGSPVSGINGGRALATGVGLTRLNPGQSSSSLPSGVGSAVKSRVDAYLSRGYAVIVPTQAQGGFFARRSDGSEYAWIVGNGTKGTPSANNVDPRNDFRKGATDSPRPLDFLGSAEQSDIAAKVAGTQLGAVDLRSGVLSLSEGDEVTVGQGEFPYSLGFNRRYASNGPASGFGELGAGWTHNWESSAYRKSDVTALIAASDVVSAAPTLIAVLAAIQAGRNDSVEHSLVSGIALNWWQDAGINNVVLLNGGGRSGRFVKLADGGWRNSASPADQLTLGGASPAYPQIFDWTLADKSVMRFERFSTTPASPYYNNLAALSHGRVGLTTWSFPGGAQITLTYSSADPTNGPSLQTVSNNVGASLNFTYTANPSQTATANCMQQAGAVGDPYAARLECRMAAVRGGRLVSVSNGSNTVNFGYLEDCHLNTSYCAFYLTTATGSLRRNRSYAYGEPSGAATPYIFGYQRLLQTVSDEGVSTPRARYVWFATAGESAPQVRESYDASNRKTTYFSSGGLFSSAEDALGGRIRQSYEKAGRLAATTDAMGRTTTQTYYGSGRSRRVQTPWGDARSFEYDNRGNLTKTTHSPVANCGTDAWWCQTSVIRATYHATWNKPTSLILPATADGQPAQTWTWSYNGQGLVSQMKSPAVFDARNNVDAQAIARTWYDAYGRVIQTEDPTGLRTTRTWGGGGLPAYCLRLSRVSTQSGGLALTTTFGCNAAGDVTSVTDPRGSVTTTTYDALRRRTAEAGPAGTNAQTQWVYDLNGDLTQERRWDATASAWRTTTTTYSPTHRPLTATDPSGDRSRTCYDALDRPTITIDPSGRARRTYYNLAGQPAEIRQFYTGDLNSTNCALTAALPDGVTTHRWRAFQYNAGGLQSVEIDANGNKTSTAYDGLGRPFVTTYADGSWSADHRNERDQVVQTRRRSGDWRQAFYDGMGRVYQLWEHADGAAFPVGRNSRTGYDLSGRSVWKDVSTQTGATWVDANLRDIRTYGYDAAGRTTSETVKPNDASSGSTTLTTGYGYDASGNRTSIVWPGGYTATYGFDALNRPTTASFGGHTATTRYDSLGRRTGVTRSNGTGTTWSYEADGDLAGIGHVFPNGQAAGTFAYGHDAAGRIISTSVNVTQFEWTPTTGYARTYGAANVLNQLASEVQGGTTRANSFDLNGNLTGDGVNAYGWTFGDRLVTASRTGMTATYAYDSEDRRTVKIVNGVMTRTLWSGAEEIAQLDGAGNVLRYVVPDGSGRMDGRLAVAEAGGAIAWLHTDRQGSTIATTNASGTVTGTYAYSPYGETKATGGSLGSSLPLFGYTGREFDAETGNYQYRARYYHPLLGQFLSTDPVGTQDDPNLYMYVQNDPVNNTDPDGRQTVPGTYGPNAARNMEERNAFLSDGLAAIGRSFREYPVGTIIDGGFILFDIANGPSGESAAMITGRRALREGGEAAVEGAARNAEDALPRLPRGPGSVPRAERDPRRTWSSSERQARREAQGNQCANGCGTRIDETNSNGHHVTRHADGGRTDEANHAEVCVDCHRRLHSPE